MDAELLRITKLHTALIKLYRDQDNTPKEIVKLQRGLENRILELTEPASYDSVQTLIEAVDKHGPKLDLAWLKQDLRTSRIATIRKLRTDAERRGETYVNLEPNLPGFARIPLPDFSWRTGSRHYFQLFQTIQDSATTYTQAATACTAFFEEPAAIPEIAASLIIRLVDKGFLTYQEAPAFADDIAKVQQHQQQCRQRLTDDFFLKTIDLDTFLQGGNAALELLHDQLLASATTTNLLLDQLVIQWPGPKRAELLDKWLNIAKTNLSKHELIVACTGIDPSTDRAHWQSWVLAQINKEHQDETAFRKATQEHPDLLDLAFLLSLNNVLGARLETHWWPLCQQVVTPVTPPALPTRTPTTSEQTLAPTETTANNNLEFDLDFDPDFILAEELEDITIIEPTSNKDDRIVANVSTWNNYLKPFLHENWLGLIGISSLLAAWLFFAMWLWDKSEDYRLLTGSIPMLLTTLTLGWISQFFHQRESQGAPPITTRLFAGLAVLSLPFNFLISASILAEGHATGITIGLISGGINLAIMTLITRWCASPFGFNPKHYLLAMSMLVYVPAIVNLIDATYLPAALNLSLFLGFFILIPSINQASNQPNIHFGFNWRLMSCHYLITICLVYIYFATLPNIYAIAILAGLAAIAAAHFGKTKPTILIGAGGVSLLTNFLCVSHPIILPISLALSMLLWLRQRKHLPGIWPDEVLTTYFLVCVLTVIQLTDDSWPSFATFLLPAILLVLLWERLATKQALTIVSIALPAYMLNLGVMSATTTATASSLSLILLAITTIAAYRRSVRWYRVHQWFFHLTLVLMLIPVMLPLITATALNAGIYLSLCALLWALLSPMLSDPLANAHRTTILWTIASLAAVFQISQITTADFSIVAANIVGGLFTVIALVLAAKRAQSALPIYIAQILSGVLAYSLYRQMGFVHGNSGMGLAILALLALLLAHILKILRIWHAPYSVDSYFGRDFFLRSPQFLCTPFEIMALLWMLFSMIRAITNLTPFNEASLPAIVLIIDCVILLHLSIRFHPNISGYWTLVPIIAILTSIIWSLPTPLIPHFCGLILLLLLPFISWLKRQQSLIKTIYYDPANHCNQVLTIFSVPAGIASYALFSIEQFGQFAHIATFGGIAMLLSHNYINNAYPRVFYHVVIFHLMAVWSYFLVTFIHPDIFIVTADPRYFVHWLTGAAFLLFLPSLVMRHATTPIWQDYAINARLWLASFATVVGISVLGAIGLTTATIDFIVYPIIAWILLHICCDFWNNFAVALLKAGLCIQSAILLTNDLLTGLLLGMLIMLIIDGIYLQTRYFPKLAIAYRQFQERPDKQLLAFVGHLLIALFLIIHIMLFVRTSPMQAALPHYLLYALIPILFFLKRNQDFPYLNTLGIALFAYANSFVALFFLPHLAVYQLTILHLLSAVFIVSIGCYLVFNSLARRIHLP